MSKWRTTYRRPWICTISQEASSVFDISRFTIILSVESYRLGFSSPLSFAAPSCDQTALKTIFAAVAFVNWSAERANVFLPCLHFTCRLRHHERQRYLNRHAEPVSFRTQLRTQMKSRIEYNQPLCYRGQVTLWKSTIAYFCLLVVFSSWMNRGGRIEDEHSSRPLFETRTATRTNKFFCWFVSIF